MRRNWTSLEREALMARSNAAVALLRTDPELTPYEALLHVVAPSLAVREASLEKARARRERLGIPDDCGRCGSSTDDDGFCDLCGHVTIRQGTTHDEAGRDSLTGTEIGVS